MWTNQNDYASVAYPAPGYEYATVKSGGCGVCSMLNVLEALGHIGMSVYDMVTLAISKRARVPGGTDMTVLAKAVCEKYPDMSFAPSNSVSELRRCLLDGGKAIINVDGARDIFSTGGHYIAAVGLEGDTATIVDSGYYNGKYDTPMRRKYVKVVARSVVTALMSTIDMDTKNRNPRFFLFRREEEMNIDKLIAEMTEDQAYKLMQKANPYAQALPPSQWAEKELSDAVNAGITDGSAPRRPATREEVAVMVKRAIILQDFLKNS